ncbi:MAG: stage II sporulation protein P [Eubacteriales bacterium]|nr:stage II sporulation protein P [Eubacteriales bacterium]
MQKPKRRRIVRSVISGVLTLATLWLVSVTAPAQSASETLHTLKEGAVPIFLLRLERGDLFSDDAISAPTALALSMQPLLLEGRREIVSAWSSELQQPPQAERDGEDDEGTVLSAPREPSEITVTENGVPSRTLKPSDPAGYTVFGNVYINNASSASLNTSQLSGDFAAELQDGGPQVLIIHTHGTEAYSMPAGEEYMPSDNHRTLESEKNMLRIGDEIAEALTAKGISVVHDRNLYDYPNYSGAYNRSLASIENYLAQYPSISFVLDVHRDAVEDATGNEYKLLCAEEPNAAQLEFVIGSNGGGLSHDKWRENVKLACAVQENLLEKYPTLMRPIVVRNSRYNQHMTTGSLLIEVGTAGNSLEEAIVAARIFAGGFAETIQE